MADIHPQRNLRLPSIPAKVAFPYKDAKEEAHLELAQTPSVFFARIPFHDEHFGGTTPRPSLFHGTVRRGTFLTSHRLRASSLLAWLVRSGSVVASLAKAANESP
jgi:hypothetical protein